MSDELDERVRALEAERNRPEVLPHDAPVEDLLMQLIATLHQAFTTTTDEGRWAGLPKRLAEFERLRGIGCTIGQAAARIGVCLQTGYRYERLLKAEKEAV